MKLVLPLFSLLLFTIAGRSQNFTGQWKGSFIDQSTKFMSWGGDQCDYVLEIEVRDNKVSGYSYTYFTDGAKKYYTICRLTGKIDRSSKTIEVREVERTKTNVPSNIRNCFQVHTLTYFQQGETQTLKGEWLPAPNQEGDCGYGITELTRRVLQKNASLAKAAKPAGVKKQPVQPVAKTTIPSRQKSTTPYQPVVKSPKPALPRTRPVTDVAKNNPKNNPATVTAKARPVTGDTPPPAETATIVKDAPRTNANALADKEDAPQRKTVTGGPFEKRGNYLMKTIDIENETFKVDLYDNGEIDGDSISLFFNGKLLLAHKRLSDKALTLTLNIDNDRDMNELIMYADNLGSIPPNTALMVVTDGGKRYEVRISSDLEKSGTIRFVHKPKTPQ